MIMGVGSAEGALKMLVMAKVAAILLAMAVADGVGEGGEPSVTLACWA